MKTGTLDPFKGLGEINKATLCSKEKYAERTRDTKTFAPGDEYSITIIHENQVGAEFDGQRDHSFLARVEFFKRGIPGNTNVDVLGQNQVVDGAGVGDDHLHPLESKALQILYIAAHILNGDSCIDLTGLQKGIKFISGLQAEQTTQLRLQRRTLPEPGAANPTRSRGCQRFRPEFQR